jgi:hypothetical protein
MGGVVEINFSEAWELQGIQVFAGARAEPSQAKPSQTKPSQTKPNQTKPNIERRPPFSTSFFQPLDRLGACRAAHKAPNRR